MITYVFEAYSLKRKEEDSTHSHIYDNIAMNKPQRSRNQHTKNTPVILCNPESKPYTMYPINP